MHGGLDLDRELAILARRRREAITTSNAPAWRWRQVSLPGWSMSNRGGACLTTETRCPAATRPAITPSTSVVLPDPDQPGETDHLHAASSPQAACA